MGNSRVEAENKLSHNGKCPACKSQIKVIDSDYILYETRILKIFHNGKRVVKCPVCKEEILIDG